MRGTKMNNIQNTKELVISYFNNNEDCFSFSIVTVGMPVLIGWKRQIGNCTTRTSKATIALIEYSNHYDKDTNSIISLIRDKQSTRIDVHAYSFTKEGCVDCGDIYQTSLSNSVYKFTHFDLLKE